MDQAVRACCFQHKCVRVTAIVGVGLDAIGVRKAHTPHDGALPRVLDSVDNDGVAEDRILLEGGDFLAGTPGEGKPGKHSQRMCKLTLT